MTSGNADEATKNLRRHLRFIENSCRAFDQGHEYEALRIAVALRVLFHDTKFSTSVLSLLEQKGRIHLTSISPAVPENLDPSINFYLGIPLIFGDTIRPNLNSGCPPMSLTVHDWLARPVMFNGGVWLTRQDVILKAANEDGGAHVDPIPSGKTKAMKTPWIERTDKVDGVEKTEPITDNHFPLLRAFGHEVLNSPELTALA